VRVTESSVAGATTVAVHRAISTVVDPSAIGSRDARTDTDVTTSGRSTDDANGAADRHAADGARVELGELEASYRRAIERGMTEESCEGIDAAFDEADRLQIKLFGSIGRLRALERELTVAAAANGGAPRVSGRSMAHGHQSSREPS
jgi:hypothetical protein